MLFPFAQGPKHLSHYFVHQLRTQATPLAVIKDQTSKKIRMALSIPAELKRITQFVRRAEELDGDRSRAESRLVAYYCRQVNDINCMSLSIECNDMGGLFYEQRHHLKYSHRSET